jgi:hypothetical protein
MCELNSMDISNMFIFCTRLMPIEPSRSTCSFAEYAAMFKLNLFATVFIGFNLLKMILSRSNLPAKHVALK